MWSGFPLFYSYFSSSPALYRTPPPVKSISSFDEVVLSPRPNPLVLCDIDETLLRYNKQYEDIFREVAQKYDRGITQYQITRKYLESPEQRHTKIQYIAKMEYDKYIHDTPPVATDAEGFNRLLLRIYMLNGELKFVTARGHLSQEFTRKHFTQIGVNYDDFEVHYTDATHKGEYIKKNISFDGYNDILFIDDLDNFIQNVQSHLPQIQCYKFVAKRDSHYSFPNSNSHSHMTPFSITR
jgi:hypothetical protein